MNHRILDFFLGKMTFIRLLLFVGMVVFPISVLSNEVVVIKDYRKAIVGKEVWTRIQSNKNQTSRKSTKPTYSRF
jgi:hypothetical protein